MTDYGCYIIIKNVPCNCCTQCGEEYMNGIQKRDCLFRRPLVPSVLV
ncbi:MAG: YgiT-type zinc finger protein [Clostridiales bacterium]|nr:YgiT-type zinc finger protein [Clostridiales bacterium]